MRDGGKDEVMCDWWGSRVWDNNFNSAGSDVIDEAEVIEPWNVRVYNRWRMEVKMSWRAIDEARACETTTFKIAITRRQWGDRWGEVIDEGDVADRGDACIGGEECWDMR